MPKHTFEQLRAMGYVMARPDAVPAEGESLFRTKVPDYVIDDDGCWIWQKSKTEAGYPSGYAHRRYYERANGSVAQGTQMHHVCRVPACVNPDHLEALNHKGHIIEHRLVDAGRTMEDIRIVRDDRATGMSIRAIAARHGLSYSTVRRWVGLGAEASWTEELGAAVAVPLGTCRLDGCEEVFAVLSKPGVRKQFCSDAHRSKHNNLKPEYKAKKAARDRRRRERLAALGEEQKP